jgi:SAM-dependent methyltransferase
VSAAEEYYKKSYGGGVALGATPLDFFASEMLGEGARYRVAADFIRRDRRVGPVIAEIGCGGAEFLLLMSREVEFSSLIGIDVAALGDNSGADRPKNLSIVAADLDQTWPIETASLDYLVAMMVIEHLFCPFFSFDEVRRVLKPDGLAFINLPLVTSIRNRINLLLGRLPETSVGYQQWIKRRSWDGAHLHYFSIKSIRDLCAASDLELVDLRGVGRHWKWKTRFPSLLAAEVTFVVRRRS